MRGWSSPRLVVVAALWAAQTVRTIPHWRDNDALFDYSLAVSPNAAEVHVSHGVVLAIPEKRFGGRGPGIPDRPAAECAKPPADCLP